MQATDRHVEESAFTGNDPFIAELKGHLTFEDEERLFLSAVDVRWRTAAGRHNGLECGVPAVRLFPCCEESVHVADNAVSCPRSDGHSSCLI